MSEPELKKNDLLKKIFFFLEIHKIRSRTKNIGYSNLAFSSIKNDKILENRNGVSEDRNMFVNTSILNKWVLKFSGLIPEKKKKRICS